MLFRESERMAAGLRIDWLGSSCVGKRAEKEMGSVRDWEIEVY